MVFQRNHATQVELLAHLELCDACFVPRLSDRVDVEVYSKKLLEHSMRLEAWNNGELIGLVAVYCNDESKLLAYVTNISVVPEWRGQGLAARLLRSSVDNVCSEGFSSLELEVDKRNTAALSLYKRLGFLCARDIGSSLVMTLQCYGRK